MVLPETGVRNSASAKVESLMDVSAKFSSDLTQLLTSPDQIEREKAGASMLATIHSQWGKVMILLKGLSDAGHSKYEGISYGHFVELIGRLDGREKPGKELGFFDRVRVDYEDSPRLVASDLHLLADYFALRASGEVKNSTIKFVPSKEKDVKPESRSQIQKLANIISAIINGRQQQSVPNWRRRTA
ncbi:hypothetical protein C4579_01005 [Candidatus Microgenomates bacterium]|nr:MAG: hypothetical protein C4579_01005 [Candidatus Microgenomates bacterium]